METERLPIELINRKIENQLSDSEERMFANWLNEKNEHRLYFERYRMLYDECRERDISLEEVNNGWESLKRKIDTQRVRQIRLFRITAVAASVVCILSLWGLFYFQETTEPVVIPEVSKKIEPGRKNALLELADGSVYQLGNDLHQHQVQENSGDYIYIDTLGLNYSKYIPGKAREDSVLFDKLSVPRGGEYQIILSDGTKVWLNSGTYLRYPVSFVGNKREVYLEGEAFFEVKRDTLRPFIVHSGVQRVEVLGTSFGITCYADAENHFTTLVSGLVNVQFTTQKSQVYQLAPGRQLVYNKYNNKVEEREVNVAEYVSWKDGKYVFKKKNLDEILTTLSRWYDFNVFYINSDAKNVLFSGELKRFEDFNYILKLIERTSDVQFLVKGNVVNVIKTN